MKPRPIITDSGDTEFEVEEILNHQKRRRARQTKIEYLIVWTGYPTHQMTWELEENVANAAEKFAEYYRCVEANASPKQGRV